MTAVFFIDSAICSMNTGISENSSVIVLQAYFVPADMRVSVGLDAERMRKGDWKKPSMCRENHFDSII